MMLAFLCDIIHRWGDFWKHFFDKKKAVYPKLMCAFSTGYYSKCQSLDVRSLPTSQKDRMDLDEHIDCHHFNLVWYFNLYPEKL